MTRLLQRPRWSPYGVGTGIGVLSWLTFALMHQELGTSTTMVRVAGALEGLVARAHVEHNTYFAQYLVSTAQTMKPTFEWQAALVVMLAFGALLFKQPMTLSAFGETRSRSIPGA
jgi:hypothetical protein